MNNFRKLTATLLCIGGGCLLFNGACTTPRNHFSMHTFKTADKNQDAMLDHEELKSYLTDLLMTRVDRDGNGVITIEEWRAADNAPDADAHFADLDEDQDGKVTKKEVARAIARSGDLDVVFVNLDHDRNGFISHDELERRPVGQLLKIRF